MLAPRELCAPTVSSGAPVFRDGDGGARIGGRGVGYGTEAGFEKTLSNVKVTSSLGMSSGGSVIQEVADTTDARPLPCTFTAVYADKSCALRATGKRYAARQVIKQMGGGMGLEREGPTWRLFVELTDSGGCMEKPTRPSSDESAIVEGTRPELRVVDFIGTDGSTPAPCPIFGPDHGYAPSEIARWPSDERARHASKKPFEVRCTPARDLFWFTSIDRDGDTWKSRLRDKSGKLLRLPYNFEGKAREHEETTLLLKERERLYWSGGQVL